MAEDAFRFPDEHHADTEEIEQRARGSYLDPSVVTAHTKRRSRPSRSISEAKALKLLHAFEYALDLGLPLNTFVTITFRGSLPYAKTADSARTPACVALASKVLRQRAESHGIPATYLWVLERVTGQGLHVHLLCHLPEQHHEVHRQTLERSFMAAFRWSDGDRPDNNRPVCVAPHCLHRFESFRRLIYSLKGVDPAVEEFRRDDRCGGLSGHEFQGLISGKRVGVSRNIDHSARRQVSYRPGLTARHLSCRQYVDRAKAQLCEALRSKMSAERPLTRSEAALAVASVQGPTRTGEQHDHSVRSAEEYSVKSITWMKVAPRCSAQRRQSATKCSSGCRKPQVRQSSRKARGGATRTATRRGLPAHAHRRLRPASNARAIALVTRLLRGHARTGIGERVARRPERRGHPPTTTSKPRAAPGWTRWPWCALSRG